MAHLITKLNWPFLLGDIKQCSLCVILKQLHFHFIVVSVNKLLFLGCRFVLFNTNKMDIKIITVEI